MKICEHIKSVRVALAAAASILLVGLVWALFGQTGTFDYLNWDDPTYTFACPFVKDGLSWTNVCEAFRRWGYQAIWMPVTNISYMCDRSLFGPGTGMSNLAGADNLAGVRHLVNVAIHALNALLLFGLLFALGQRASCPLRTHGSASLPTGTTGILPVALAFFLTAFWALHPQRAEAVAWIASRKELLCTTFILGGLLCWLRARRREGRGWIPALAGVYACFALACMSKPTAMCFPFLVLAVEGMIEGGRDKRDSSAGGSGVSPLHVPSRAFYILNFALFLLIAAATGALAVCSQTHPEGYAKLALYSAPLWWRILNAAAAVGLYIFQMFVPVGIHLDYRAVPGGWPVQGTLGLCVLALVALGVAGAWWWMRRRVRRGAGQDRASDRAGLFFLGAVILWFFASLGPTLGIFGSFGEHARADRFLYLPAMALPIAVMVFLCRDKRDPSLGEAASRPLGQAASRPLGQTASRPLGEAASRRFIGTMSILPVVGLVGLAMVVVLLFTAAHPVVASYRTDMTAFTRTLSIDPDNWRALMHIGEARCAEGNLAEGIDMLRHSRTVLARDPTNAKLAYALMRRGEAGDWDEIIKVCEAVASDPTRDPRGQALEALGTAELKKHRWRDAIRHLHLSIRAPQRHYSHADASLKLAFSLQNAGRCEEAREWFLWVKNRSGRLDLARRAREALIALEYSPRGILFW